MAPKKSTNSAAVPVGTDNSQSDSQDASQDSGLAVGQMAKQWGEQMKKKVRSHFPSLPQLFSTCSCSPILDSRATPVKGGDHQDGT